MQGDRASFADAQTGGWEGGRGQWLLGNQDYSPLTTVLSGFQV